MTNSVDPKEIQVFSKDAAHWWDEKGPFAPLHRLNPVRMTYIREQICAHYDLDQKSLKPLEKLRVLDIGCGGGLVCESIARLGAQTTGVDADEQAIAVAKEHAGFSGLEVDYRCGAAEDLISSSRAKPRDLTPKDGDLSTTDLRSSGRDDDSTFDVVLALEIIEHVTEPAAFVASCAKLVKPGGLLIFSTMNRTAKSYALGIIAAEYILRWVPQGTHHWEKFVKPSELARYARENGLEVKDTSGLVLEPLKNRFRISETDLSVNYFMAVSSGIPALTN